jgi:hypothetical protein
MEFLFEKAGKTLYDSPFSMHAPCIDANLVDELDSNRMILAGQKSYLFSPSSSPDGGGDGHPLLTAAMIFFMLEVLYGFGSLINLAVEIEDNPLTQFDYDSFIFGSGVIGGISLLAGIAHALYDIFHD